MWIDIVRTSLCKLWGQRRLILLVYLLNLVLALPLALEVERQWRSFLGGSEAAEELVHGFNQRWFSEFGESSESWDAVADPTVSGAGALLGPLDEFVTGRFPFLSPVLVGAGGVYLAFWIFAGGAFVASCRFKGRVRWVDWAGLGVRYFGRCVRLAILFAVVMAACFWLSAFLGRVVEGATRDAIDERIVFGWTMGRLVLVMGLLWLARQWFNYARALVIVEERSSVGLALLRALSLMWRHAAGFGALVVTLLLISWALFGMGIWISPGAGQESRLGVFMAFAVGQVFILGRITHRALSGVGYWAFHERILEAWWLPASVEKEVSGEQGVASESSQETGGGEEQ